MQSSHIHHADVVIVGGGPAGLAAAEAAAQQGAHTIVLERQKEIGYPIHTSGGSWISDMKAIGIPSTLYHPIKHVTFLSPNNSCDFTYEVPTCCVLDVRGLYQHLAVRAVKAGASIQPASPVEGPILEDTRIIGVRGKNSSNEPEEWRAAVTIDCSGISSTLATRTGLHAGYQRYGYGAEWDLYAPNYPEDRLYLIVGGQVAPAGYAWIFPRGNGRVRLGVGVLRPDVDADARAYLLSFTDRLPQLAPVFAGASPLEYHTGLFPSEGMAAHFVSDGLMTAGDSAGHGSALVGEGIRFAIYSGQMAGAIAAKAAQRSDTSAPTLAEFDRTWRAKFGRNLDIALLINKRIAAYSDTDWDRSLDLLKKLSPEQAAEALRGDFSMKLIMGIIQRNPTLLAKGARAFVNSIAGQLGRNKPLTETDIPQQEVG
jgi:digeranylgeranylglycerophospholipid reductase